MLEKLNAVQDNVWAFALFLLASALAATSSLMCLLILYHFHGTDYGAAKDLLGFAGTVAMTGAALFHGKSQPGEKQ